jgi:hypothetical protein
VKRNILVTGSHRSGSTWVGQMLAEAPGAGYIHEPFNIEVVRGRLAKPFPNWFQYIDDGNAGQFTSYLSDIIDFKYPLIRAMGASRSSRDAARVISDGTRAAVHRVRGDRAIVKDPIAIFSAEWMAKEFDMDILVMIRHPAAFCSSLKMKNWRFDFNNFLRQPKIMDRVLWKFEKEIREHSAVQRDITSEGILLWNCIHQLIAIYRHDHPSWLFVTHEDMSFNPVSRFRAIYASLGLEFTPRVEWKILDSSGAHNPTEQTPRREYVRDSKKNIRNWEKRLTDSEIAQIRDCTSELFHQFYTASDWSQAESHPKLRGEVTRSRPSVE